MNHAHHEVPRFGIVIHGGAGTILREKLSADKEAEYRAALRQALEVGYEILAAGGAALDAVQKAVNVMEDSPLFNAGKGAVFTHAGTNEQDATIMDGATGMAGAVAGLRRIKNPIDLARLVMERSSHVLLISDGAEAFAREHGMAMMPPEYFFTQQRYDQLQEALVKEQSDAGQSTVRLSEDDKHGTVGAVALDQHGHLAAATSSGGMTNKRFGRAGDSAVVGAGTWADDLCAVSTTGHGEYFMRGVVAYDIAVGMRYRELSLEAAAQATMASKLDAKGGTGGLIAIDRDGNIVLPFNTPGMYRGHLLSGGDPWISIFRE